MQKLVTAFIFHIFFSNPVFSQWVTVQQMIEKTQCPETDCFDKFFLSKRFERSQVEKNIDRTAYEYFSSEKFESNNQKVLVPNLVDWIITKEGFVLVSFSTVDMEGYLFLLDQIKILGFEPISKDNLEDGHVVNYGGNDKYEDYLVSVSTHNVNRQNENFRLYNFTVVK